MEQNIVYDYSYDDIEALADAQNKLYDPERLEKLKPLDVYDFAEKQLGLNIDWKYLTPIGSLDAMLVYSDCIYPVWPRYFKQFDLPTSQDLLEHFPPQWMTIKANTIVVCQSVLDRGHDYKERFSVAHECGHFLLHPQGFTMASCEAFEPYEYGSYKKMTPQQRHESHANRFAAALLMPQGITRETYMKLRNSDIYPTSNTSDRILAIMSIMAEMCNVTVESMSYRLSALGLIKIM